MGATKTNVAKETNGNLAAIKAKTDNLDLAITGLRDAITGISSKTLTDAFDVLNQVFDTQLGGEQIAIAHGEVKTSNPSYTDGTTRSLSLTVDGRLRVYDDPPDILEQTTYGAQAVMTVTNLHSLANSNTVGWQSDKVDNLTTTKATDYLITFKIVMANTAPANNKSVDVFICPFYYDSSTWYAASQGTTTLPTGTQGTTTIAEPNNLIPAIQLAYTTQNMVLQGTVLLSNILGTTMPHGFSIIIRNYSGAAIHSSGSIINYTPIKLAHVS